MGLKIPPLTVKILLESNPLKSIILVRRLAVDNWTKRRSPSENRGSGSRGRAIPARSVGDRKCSAGQKSAPAKRVLSPTGI